MGGASHIAPPRWATIHCDDVARSIEDISNAGHAGALAEVAMFERQRRSLSRVAQDWPRPGPRSRTDEDAVMGWGLTY
jgi:hypothetical protein